VEGVGGTFIRKEEEKKKGTNSRGFLERSGRGGMSSGAEKSAEEHNRGDLSILTRCRGFIGECWSG